MALSTQENFKALQLNRIPKIINRFQPFNIVAPNQGTSLKNSKQGSQARLVITIFILRIVFDWYFMFTK